MNRPRILFAILDWGIGHATRTTPLIEAAAASGAEVFVASRGTAAAWLASALGGRPGITLLEKPGTPITYARRGTLLRIATQMPRFLASIAEESAWAATTARTLGITHIVSDNCYGVRVPGIPSVLISHQLHLPVPAPLRPAARAFVQRHARRFAEVWVPDLPGPSGGLLSGPLAAPLTTHPHPHPQTQTQSQTHFIGPLSHLPAPPSLAPHTPTHTPPSPPRGEAAPHPSSLRGEAAPHPSPPRGEAAPQSQPQPQPQSQSQSQSQSQPQPQPQPQPPLYLGLVSGPEPHRTRMEHALRAWMETAPGPDDALRLVIAGKPGGGRTQAGRVTTWYDPTSEELAWALAEAGTVVCRSGYSTLLDLAVLGRTAVLVPTPGQPEQEDLARHWARAFGFATCTSTDLERGRVPGPAGNPPHVRANDDAIARLEAWLAATLHPESAWNS